MLLVLCLCEYRPQVALNEDNPLYGDNNQDDDEKSAQQVAAPRCGPAPRLHLHLRVETGPEVGILQGASHALVVRIELFQVLETTNGLVPFSILEMGHALLVEGIVVA